MGSKWARICFGVEMGRNQSKYHGGISFTVDQDKIPVMSSAGNTHYTKLSSTVLLLNAVHVLILSNFITSRSNVM